MRPAIAVTSIAEGGCLSSSQTICWTDTRAVIYIYEEQRDLLQLTTFGIIYQGDFNVPRD